MEEMQEFYSFHLIFKGLFRCVIDRKENLLSVLLVDARSGKLSQVTNKPFRDHRAVIEFHLADWRDRPAGPVKNLVQVDKPNKGPVGMYLLDGQDVTIGLSFGDLSPELTLIEDDSATSLLKLPRLDEIDPGSEEVSLDALENGTGCIARVLNLACGEVRSERASTFDGAALKWAFSRPRSKTEMEQIDPKDPLLAQELKAAREINLDLRVTMKVPQRAAVLLDANPFNRKALNPPAFILRPDPGRDLEVWVKNRELEVVLTESDEPGKDDGCPLAELIDFDFELHYELSANPSVRHIPYRPEIFLGGPVSAGGCACGGCTGGGKGG